MFWKTKDEWCKSDTNVMGLGILTTGLLRTHRDWVIGDYQFGYIFNIESTEDPEYFVIRKKRDKSATIWLPIRKEVADADEPVRTILEIGCLTDNEISKMFEDAKNDWIEFMEPIIKSRRGSEEKKFLGFSSEGGIKKIGRSASTKELLDIGD